MRKILLTLDYELFGNGSGDVFKHMIEPTDEILRIARKHNTPVTIFFEVVEYWKLKEQWDKGNNMGYHRNPIEAMEKQLRKAYRQGHDIQLHIHPQWVNAQWTKNGWKVDKDKWRLGGYEDGNEEALTDLLNQGKVTLEKILGDKEYECIALRAGGYNIQPSRMLIKAMRKVGLKSDSSVVPGAKETGKLSRYDYTSADETLGLWYCEEKLEVAARNQTDIVELPIVALPLLRLQKYLSFDRIKSILRNRKSAKETFEAKIETKGQRGGIISKMRYFFQYETQTWDFCLFSKSLHRKFLKSIKEQRERKVFTLIGHPKSLTSSDGLAYLIEQLQGSYSFTTVSNYIKTL